MAIIGEFGSAPDFHKQGYRGQGYVVHGAEEDVLKVFRASDVVLVKGAAVSGTEAEFEFYPMFRNAELNDFSNAIGDFIKRQRHSKGLTQEQLAEIAGVSLVAQAHIEGGYSKPNREYIAKLQEIFGADIKAQLVAELGC